MNNEKEAIKVFHTEIPENLKAKLKSMTNSERAKLLCNL
jgi:hypothetical protein